MLLLPLIQPCLLSTTRHCHFSFRISPDRPTFRPLPFQPDWQNADAFFSLLYSFPKARLDTIASLPSVDFETCVTVGAGQFICFEVDCFKNGFLPRLHAET